MVHFALLGSLIDGVDRGGTGVVEHAGAFSRSGRAEAQHRQHQHRGNNDLVGRDRYDVRQQDHPVESQQHTERGQQYGGVLGDAHAADI